MEFRDLKKQYSVLKDEIDKSIAGVLSSAQFISGGAVRELEAQLAEYVGVKHCITCANGTDAITLALKAWGVGKGDAVFVPDFTFFSTGECPAAEGAAAVFVDVDERTYNIDPDRLEEAIIKVKNEGRYTPKVVAAVDLFGQPADYPRIIEICHKYGLLLLEDGAQGFGGSINGRKACSFGDISTTSFFPAKPLGCYGDGGAVFTNNDEWAQLMNSYRVHGKGTDKYDNVRIGMNSRLDTMQAAILQVKLRAFDKEVECVNEAARHYTELLKDKVKTPVIPEGFGSSWAQYTIQLPTEAKRNALQAALKEAGIPSMVYYPKPMHQQTAFQDTIQPVGCSCDVAERLCRTVLSLPMHPYMEPSDIERICSTLLASL